MSFLFATSQLPAVKRPQVEEEEEDNAQPMQRSGMVRAISHLPVTRRATNSKPGAMFDTDSKIPVATVNVDTKPITVKQITYADKRTQEIADNVRKADPRLEKIPLRTKYGGRRVPNSGPEHSPLNVLPQKPTLQQQPTPLP